MFWLILSLILLIIFIVIINEFVFMIRWLNASVQTYERIGRLNEKRKRDENDCKK